MRTDQQKRDKQKEWYLKNKEYVKLKHKEWKEKNKESLKVKQKKWREENKETIRKKQRLAYIEKTKDLDIIRRKPTIIEDIVIQEPRLVKEAYDWITLKVRLRGICSLVDISHLIHYFDILGGNHRLLDSLRTGVQLEKMWLYCQMKLNERILEKEIKMTFEL